MRKAKGCYLIAIGVLEIVVYLAGARVPVIAWPHFGLLWLPFFAGSKMNSTMASLSMALLVSTAGAALLTNRKHLAIPYCVVGGVVALVDIYLPLMAVFAGGFVGGPVMMVPVLLALLVYDGIPLLISVSIVLH